MSREGDCGARVPQRIARDDGTERVGAETLEMRVAFYGDSLTEGWPGVAFWPLLEQRLPQHTLVNRGRAGDTTSDLLARLRRDGVERVDLAVVWIGANDAFAAGGGEWSSPGERAPDWRSVVAAFARTYDLVLDLVSAAAPRLMLVPPTAPDDVGEPWMSRLTDLAGVAERAAAARPQTRFLDLRPAFAATAGPLTIDGIHLNEAGAVAVASVFAAAVDDEEQRTQS
jgi:lysophospholipase L1-like esterase